ncbi:MAG: PAS domain-containing protein, partial [Cohaesibacteraceae bacterium]
MTAPLIDLLKLHGDALRREGPWLWLGLTAIGGLVVLLGVLVLSDMGSSPTALLIILCLFAAAGIAALLALALGFLRFSSRQPQSDCARRLMDQDGHGILFAHVNGQVLYANEAYGALTGADDASGVRMPDRVFGTDAEAADTLYQLLRSVADGNAAEADVRLSRGAAGEGEPRWYHMVARPLPVDETGAYIGQANISETDYAVAWRIADVTAERARQEQVFQDLQQAVDYLDHAPAGFFSCDPEGTINYMNATLAGWLGYDIAVIDQAGLMLDDLLAGDGAALLAATPATADMDGVARIVDVDLVRRNGARLPVRIHHRV